MRKTLDLIKEAIAIERDALEKLPLQQTCDFDALIDAILKSTGRVVVTGIGKSGIIGKKISTTFASTGTPSLFLHPVEALHGDLGMLSNQDIFLMISYSGETEEILRLIPHVKYNRSRIISMTGNPQSSLAKHSDFHINIHVEKEACPLRLAPTSSTTATLVMGDALSAALIQKRGFKEENFARLHPGGRLGKMLLTYVQDVMRRSPLPLIPENTPFSEVVNKITEFELGVALVTDKNSKLMGIITDGDLRRALELNQRCFELMAHEFMNRKPKTARAGDNLFEAEKRMNENKITSLVVIDEERKPIGLLHIHSLANA